MGAAVHPRILLFGLALVAAAGAGAWPAGAEAARRQPQRRPAIVPAGRIEEALRHGRPVLLGRVVVKERLVLTGTDTVRVPFRCRRCRFEKGIAASGVTFERAVDLAGARIAGPASFRGTTFHGPAVFGATEQCSEDSGFRQTADFSLAVFDDLASFDTATFEAKAVFDNGQFRAHADFGKACFDGGVSFRAAAFDKATRFTQADFSQGAVFDAASFASGATFLNSTFTGTPDVPAASFDGATSGGDLDFTFVPFAVDPEVPPAERADTDIATFSYLVCRGSVFFQEADFPVGYGVAMDHLHVADLVLDVNVARQVDNEDNERAVLAVIESSAKDRGDLGVANDAHYQAELLVAKHYHEPWRALDYVFYRGIAGYFVRPLRPIGVLLVLVVLLALLRLGLPAARPGVEAHARTRFRRSLRAVGRGSRSVIVDVLDTIALVGRRGTRAGELSLPRRLEIFVYRLLVVCSLLALANANPTLRQMVDSLF